MLTCAWRIPPFAHPPLVRCTLKRRCLLYVGVYRVVRESAKLRAKGLKEATAEVIDDVSWYYKRCGACQVDGFDVRSGHGIALRASRSPLANAPTYMGVVDVAAIGREPKSPA
nr:hypothetical protein [Pandoravirus massiliensis]